MLGMSKEDLIGYYMLSVLNLEDEFSLDEIQENNDSFLLDINEDEGIIARVNFSTIFRNWICDRLHRHYMTLLNNNKLNVNVANSLRTYLTNYVRL